MKVNIGILKNELSKYLNRVRKGGEITITDRNEPIAKIIPLEKTVIRSDCREWLKKHPPIKVKKKQPSSGEFIKQMRDEE